MSSEMTVLTVMRRVSGDEVRFFDGDTFGCHRNCALKVVDSELESEGR